MFVMCRGTTCTFGLLTASGESVPEVTSFINTYTRDILLISWKKIEKSRIIIWPPTGCKKYGTIFFFFNGKKKTQAKLESASVTTWFNQRCVCRRFHSHFLHFFFLSFCLFSCFITRASDVFQHLAGTWQAVHLSRARPRSLPQQSQDALCQLLLYTVARTASKKLFKCSSNQLFSGAVEVCLQPALQEKKERKCGAVKLKKRMKAEHTSPRRCIILVDGSPVTLMLWTMNAPQDDKKTRAANLVCGCPRQKKETSTLQKCDWFFMCTCLSEFWESG